LDRFQQAIGVRARQAYVFQFSSSTSDDISERPVSKSMSTSDPGGLLVNGGLPSGGSVIGRIG
jgi:hypothetical protein